MYWNHSDIKNVYLHKYLSLCSTFFSFSGENRNYVDLDRLNFRRSLTINWNWIFCFRCKTFRLPSVKMGQNLTFEVNFLCQKSSESFSLKSKFFCYWYFLIKSIFNQLYYQNDAKFLTASQNFPFGMLILRQKYF